MREGERILIVEDEETFLHSTADLLRRENYHCDCARCAAEALKSLGAGRYDLLIADIKMPGNRDFEFFRALPGCAKDLPVILVTGHASLVPAVESMNPNVFTSLTKPIDFDELLANVKAALFLPRLHQSVRDMRERLISWIEDFRLLEAVLLRSPAREDTRLMDAFLGISLFNNVDLLADLRTLTASSCGHPLHENLDSALKETLDILEKMKELFHPEELDGMRRRLAGPSPF